MKVIVWSKPACVQCNAVKRSLDKAGVAFEEKRLDHDLEQLEAFKAQGHMSAPIVEATGVETFSGNQPDLVKEIIAKALGQ